MCKRLESVRYGVDEDHYKGSDLSVVVLINWSMLLGLVLVLIAQVAERTGLQAVLSIVVPSLTLCSGILLGAISRFRALDKNNLTIGILGLFVVLCSLLSVNRLASVPELWSGFGQSVVLVQVVLIAFLVAIRSVDLLQLSMKARMGIINFSAVALIALYVPVLIQPSYALLNIGDTTYHVLDEILAPIVGKFPYFDYSPQYTMIYGWVLFPLRIFRIPAESMMQIVILFCNVLIISVPLLLVRIAKIAIPRIQFFPTLLASLSILFVSGASNGASVQMKEFSVFGRFVPLLISFVLLTKHFFKSSQSNNKALFIFGFSIGVATLNNPEMGLLFLVAYLVSVAIPAARRIIDTKDLIIVVGTASGFLLSYLLAGFVATGQLNLSSFVGIRLGGSTLYPDAKIDLFGTHIISIGLCIAAVSRGVQHQLSESVSIKMLKLSVLEICSGFVLGGLLVKFFLFPVGPGALQLLIPSLLSSLFLLSDLFQDFRMPSIHGWRSLVVLGPTALITFLPFGAVVQVPYPIDEMRRIFSDHSGETDWSTTAGRPSDGWSIGALNSSYDSLIQRIDEISDDLSHSGAEVMYFGVFGNTVQLATGIENGLGIAAPESLRFGGNQPILACKPIDRTQPEFVIAYRSEFPCSGYRLNEIASRDQFRVYEHVD